MASVKDASEKPSIDDFKLGRPLGEGNFSRIMLATHIATGEEFALKVIEKQRIKRLKARHPNIFNEINMEKEVLNKLRHANIIRLYQTFQDESNLYFLLEYLNGGELLQQLVHGGYQVGVHEDLARFYLADMVNAVEYIHTNGVLHRDLKPENMVVSELDDHLRLIDFGTAKDVASTALQGPNFVGTPEYMAPETVDNKETTAAGDIWALGSIAFQLLAGETPFSGGSVYLTLLKVQAGVYTMPAFLSDCARDLISKCLSPRPEDRPSIADIKAHAFFRDVNFECHMSKARPDVHFANEALFELITELHEADKQRLSHQPLAFDEDTVQHRIKSLSDNDRQLLMHLLERKQLLHSTSIYPRFFPTPSLGRCVYARNGGYVGLTHNLQNQWSDKFEFMVVSGPMLGKHSAATEPWPNLELEAAEFRRLVIKPANEMLPAFVIFCGDLLAATPGSSTYADQAGRFRQLLDEIYPEIKLVFVPGSQTFGESVREATRSEYTALFGDDQFCFWYGGVKFIVVNSSVLAREDEDPVLSKQHHDWLVREMENGKLCAKETIVLSAHSFHSLVQGPELPPHLKPAHTNQTGHVRGSGFSSAMKKRYTELFAKNPPRLIITNEGPENGVVTVQTTVNHDASADENDDETVTAKKTEMVVCSPTMGDASKSVVIHVATVMQSGITVTQMTPLEKAAKSMVTAPEDIDVTLTSSAYKLNQS